MARNNDHWKTHFSSFPNWVCPYCQNSVVNASKDDIITRETPNSKIAHDHEAWDFEWIDLRFCAFLNCQDSNCGETIVASGTARIEHDHYAGPFGREEEFVTIYRIETIVPGPSIFPIKDCVPEDISDHLREIFSLFWVSPSASINRLRVCLEDLLTQQKVRRFSSKGGKRNVIQLHDRIIAFSKKNDAAANSLLALKWIGNSGSHGGKRNNTTRDQVLEAMDIFEHALDQIYDRTGVSIAKKVKKINAKRGF